MGIEQNIGTEDLSLNPEELGAYMSPLKKRFANIIDKDIDVWDRAADKGSDLKQRYNDYTSFAAWHVLAGSTPRPDVPLLHKDFPGEDSVEQWIAGLEAEQAQ